jgi:hypothetical protein
MNKPQLLARGHKLYPHGKALALRLMRSIMEYQGSQKKSQKEGWETLTAGHCKSCGETVLLEFKGDTVRAQKPCQSPKGLAPCKVTLNVPTGKIVVANDLRDLFPITGEDDLDTPSGLVKTTQAYAKAGMFHAFVGNTCPSVYQTGRKSFLIASGERKSRSRIRQVAGICTDLWWVSLADMDAFLAAGGALGPDIDVVECPPGTYEFTHKLRPKDGNFTRIRHIGPAKKPKDFRKAWMAKDYTLEEVLASFEKSWDDYLSGTTSSKEGRTQRMLDHLFFTLGNGMDWHPNGWGSSGPVRHKKGLPALKPLKGTYTWYPTGDYSLVGSLAGFESTYPQEVKKLNPSFRRGLVLCLENIAQGCKPRSHGRIDPHEMRSVQGTKALAEAALSSFSRNREASAAERKFVAKFGLEGAEASYRAAKKLGQAILAACPQSSSPGPRLVAELQHTSEGNSGSTQKRVIRIATYNGPGQWDDHEIWPVEVYIGKLGSPTVKYRCPKSGKARKEHIHQAIESLHSLTIQAVDRWHPKVLKKLALAKAKKKN